MSAIVDSSVPQPDNVVGAKTDQFFIDQKRTRFAGPEKQHGSVWVAVVSPEREEADSPEAKVAAVKYVATKYGWVGAIAESQGPHPDDGRVGPHDPTAYSPAADGVMSADEYMKFAATAIANKKTSATTRFVSFHLVVRGEYVG